MLSRIYKQFLMAMLAILGLVGADAFAQVGPQASVTVSAQVNAACRFQTTLTASMTIANTGVVIDPALGTQATGNTTLTYRCTNGTNPEFQIDGGGYSAGPSANVTLQGGVPANTLVASIQVTSGGAGGGMGVNRTAQIDGTISAAAIDAAAPDAYSQVVLIDIRAQ